MLDENQRERVLDALADLLGRCELQQITIVSVCERSAVSESAIRQEFDDVLAIGVALVKRTLVDSTAARHRGIEVDGTPTAVFTEAIAVYLDLHRDNPYRVRLREIVALDPGLRAFDLEDSRARAAYGADLYADGEASGTRGEIEERILLVLELTDGVIRLIGDVEDDEAVRLIDGFSGMAVSYILGQRT